MCKCTRTHRYLCAHTHTHTRTCAHTNTHAQHRTVAAILTSSLNSASRVCNTALKMRLNWASFGCVMLTVLNTAMTRWLKALRPPPGGAMVASSCISLMVLVSQRWRSYLVKTWCCRAGARVRVLLHATCIQESASTSLVGDVCRVTAGLQCLKRALAEQLPLLNSNSGIQLPLLSDNSGISRRSASPSDAGQFNEKQPANHHHHPPEPVVSPELEQL